MALSVVSVVLIARSERRREQLAELAIVLGIAVLTTVFLLMAIGGIRGMKGAVYYNLKLVPMDQYWYFGGDIA